MKVFGHPVHLMLAHFPTALLPMDVVCSALGAAGFGECLTVAAFYASVGGVLTGWLAAITGAADLMGVARERQPLVGRALLHGSINGTVLLAFSVFALLSYRKYPSLRADTLVMVAIKGILVLALIAGNYFGASLVLDHGVGRREAGR